VQSDLEIAALADPEFAQHFLVSAEKLSQLVSDSSDLEADASQ
jgi:hypothetical protein